jgi:lipoyl(octanoyl) transferase
MNKQVLFKDLGLIDYKKCWDYQEELFAGILATKSANRKEEKSDKTNNYLLFCEHPHVYTLGKSGDEKNLLVNEDYLKSRGATFHKINRGGDITYHGPGQIVGYPILDLENFFFFLQIFINIFVF